jgi:ParB family chromosome partitioning protein
VRIATSGVSLVELTEQEIQAKVKEYEALWKDGKQVHIRPRWHTPPEYVEAVREVLGSIDLDPASCDLAQETVKAKKYYTAEMDGLKFDWYGKLFVNPNYQDEQKWFSKAIDEYRRGNVTEAIIMTHTSRTYEGWFNLLCSVASAICFVNGQIQWVCGSLLELRALQRIGEGDKLKWDAHGSIVFYFGENKAQFKRVFSKFGVCYGK